MGIESINTMTKPISSAEQMQPFLEQGVGDETLGSRTLGTLTKGKLLSLLRMYLSMAKRISLI